MADREAQQGKDDTINTDNQNIDWEHLRATAVERAANATRDFCLFMRDLYVPEGDIKLAPDGGWPEINKDSFARLGKIDAAVDVLRNMSYIDREGLCKYYEVVPEVVLADYTDVGLIKMISEGDVDTAKTGLELWQPLPPSCISFVQGETYEGRTQFVLDCRFAVVCWVDLSRKEAGTRCFDWMDADDQEDPEEVDLNEDRALEVDEDEEAEQDLRNSAAWPIEEFFEMLKTKFRSMDQLPGEQRKVCSAQNDRNRDFSELREIFTKHGWPDDYQKTECMREVIALNERNGRQ